MKSSTSKKIMNEKDETAIASSLSVLFLSFFFPKICLNQCGFRPVIVLRREKQKQE